PGDDDYYDVYIASADGSGEVCLTCGKSGYPGKHAGNASWHPSGEYLVFQAEKEEYYTDNKHALAHPGVGFNNDLYLITADGTKVWQLTDLDTKQKLSDKTPFTGVLHAHFSNNGSILSWAEKVDKGGEWGVWVIKVADFSIAGGVPVLSNIREYQPGEQDLYYETNDFSADDTKLLICGNLDSDQREIGMDIYELDIATGNLERLTNTFDKWDESGHYSPDQQWIAYISSDGYTTNKGRKWWKWGKAEFWLMKTDKSISYPITFFNCPDATEFRNQRIMPAYIVWRPDGLGLLAGIVIEEDKNELTDELIMIELENIP
ncbi:MAG: hypothetical protein ABIJ16_06910, partial [Bacteroidota bacterium]